MFTHKKDKLLELLSAASENLREASSFFQKQSLASESDLLSISGQMKEAESKGDNIIHDIIKELNTAFITPIEREDILQLAMNIDDILDGMEEAAALLEIYGLTEPISYFEEFLGLLDESAAELKDATALLTEKKLYDIHPYAIKLKDNESKCDELARKAVRELFQVHKDNPIRIIQYKEIYETLEEIADSYQRAANTFESIIMKNA